MSRATKPGTGEQNASVQLGTKPGAGQQNTQLLYGDFELSMRAPYMLAPAGSPLSCDPGVYAYFTAGYVNKDGKWNEMNFGFHPVSFERTVSLSACGRAWSVPLSSL